MSKYPLIGGSICAVILIVLASLTNVVGDQTVQVSQQNTLKESINQKDLLFQTILDLANNKDIQRIILSSQTKVRGFFNPILKSPIISPSALTKKHLNIMLYLGLVLLKTMSKSKVSSLIKHHQLLTSEVQKQITSVIDKDARLTEEIHQLSTTDCHCGDTLQYPFLVICSILRVLLEFCIIFLYPFFYEAGALIFGIGIYLSCWWTQP